MSFEIPTESCEIPVEINPELAARLLDTNTRNRPISWRKVNDYSRQMTRGNWLYNPSDAIAVDTGGVLINGQHRMLAILDSETTQKFLLATGVDPEAQNVMDTGIRRTTAHQLHIEGHKNSQALSAIARIHIQWHEGNIISRMNPPTTLDIKHWLEDQDHDKLTWAIEQTFVIVRNLPLQMGPTGAALYDFAMLDQEQASQFVYGLVEGTGMDKGNPILTLIRYLHRQHLSGFRHSTHHQLWLVVSTWNHWRRGNSLGKIMSPSDWKMSTFPFAK